MATTDWKEQIEAAAYDLTHMEINTIIASDMTAAKAPTRPRELLHKIASKYDGKIKELLIEYELNEADNLEISKSSEPVEDGKEPTAEELEARKKAVEANNNRLLRWTVQKSGFFSFQVLKERAIRLENQIAGLIDFVDKPDDDVHADQSILHRINRNCTEILDILYQKDKEIKLINDTLIMIKKASKQGERDTEQNIESQEADSEVETIKKILQSPLSNKMIFTYGDLSHANENSRKSRKSMDQGDIDLDLRQMSLLKKAFDIGTSRIALQTIVGLDGDVTTRIAKRFADNQIPLVNELHHDGIRLSVNYWENLINTISKFGEAIIDGIFKK